MGLGLQLRYLLIHSTGINGESIILTLIHSVLMHIVLRRLCTLAFMYCKAQHTLQEYVALSFILVERNRKVGNMHVLLDHIKA